MEQSQSLRFVLTDESTRTRILRYIRTKAQNYFSFQNVNLAYGVEDTKNHFFITMFSYVSRAIKRNDDDYDDAAFLLLSVTGTYYVSCELRTGEIDSISFNPLSLVSHDAVKAALTLYESWQAQSAFEKELAQNDPDFSLYRLKSKLLIEYLGK